MAEGGKRLAATELQGQKVDGEKTILIRNSARQMDEAQIKAFTQWANFILKRRNLGVPNSLEKDFQDGILLINMAEILTDVPVKERYNKNPKILVQKIENITIAKEHLKKNGFDSSDIDSQDIARGSSKPLLGLFWLLVSHYHLKDLRSRWQVEGEDQDLDSLQAFLDRAQQEKDSVTPRRRTVDPKAAKAAADFDAKFDEYKAFAMANRIKMDGQNYDDITSLAALRKKRQDLLSVEEMMDLQNLEQYEALAQMWVEVQKLNGKPKHTIAELNALKKANEDAVTKRKAKAAAAEKEIARKEEEAKREEEAKAEQAKIEELKKQKEENERLAAEARRKAEEIRRQAELDALEDARRKAEEQRKRDEEARRKAEQDALEAARRRREEEDRLAEEARRRAEEARRQAEQDALDAARRRREEEEERRRREEEERRRREEEEARRKREEEERRRKAEEEEARRKAEEERRRREEEEARKRAEAEAARKHAEEEARRKAEEEEARRRAEEEARRRAEEEARRRQQQQQQQPPKKLFVMSFLSKGTGCYITAHDNGSVVCNSSVAKQWEYIIVEPLDHTGVPVRLRSWHGKYIHHNPDGTVSQYAPGAGPQTDIWLLTREPDQTCIIRTNDGGVLNADAGWGGSVICRQDDGSVNVNNSWRGTKIKAVNIRGYFGKFLSVSKKGEVKADQTNPGENETLTLERAPTANGPGKCYYLRSYHGKYVTAELKKGHVESKTDKPQDWEMWWFEKRGESRGVEGDAAIRSYHGKYLGVQKDSTFSKGIVEADRNAAGDWEVWTVFHKDLSRGKDSNVKF
eukprot:TRINITY_DN1029_c0_g1_i4.p1 TRINITY_DN1029_c0_g1~~TRINITY_DN1029_c0_g1_i4.p1  ORF type:complete len:824 (-),score=343.40 TRINITY_DN1029_c0_g1_i4:115-2538(-)